MKKKRFILTAFAVLAGAGLAMGATNEVSALLQKGLFEEEANRNLDAAVQAYQAVITQTDKDRQFAATAIFRLGECYRKLGKTNEANEQYRRILREFPDQTELAKLSREYAGAAEVSPGSNLQEPPALQDKIAAVQAEINTHERELRELMGDRKNARVFAQQNFPNPVLTSLMQDAVKTKQELARKKSELGDKHPDVAAAQEALQVIDEQIDAQLKAIKADVGTKLAQAQGTLADLKKHAAESAKEVPTSGTQRQSSIEGFEDNAIKRYQVMIQDSPDLINAKDSMGDTPLNSAAKNGQLKVVKFLLDNKANIEARDGVDQTPLLNAAQGEKRDILELLIERGADVNAVTQSAIGRQGYGALHYAAAAGNKAIAELLLAHGAKVDARDASGATPLMVSVGKGFKSVAEMLIARGADVNGRDKEGKSVLIVGIERNHPLIVEMLLAGKADVNLASKDGYTALIAAVNGGQPETVKVLLEHGADVRAQMAENHASTPRWTALDAAVVMNDNASLKLLLENHADPNATFDLSDGVNHERDSTPLILATEHKHADSAAILLDYKADVNGRNAEGRTALWQAALIENDRTMAELLLKNKADTDIKYQHGQTVLQLAVIYGKTEMVELLLANRANINAQNDDGQTALHLAANAGAPPIVELLLAHGADVNLKDSQGNTALDLAENQRNPGFGAGIAGIPNRPLSPSRPLHFPGGSTPLTYQWTVNSSGANGGPEGSNNITALLRQHGALAEVDISTIRVTRQGMSSASIVFRNGAEDHNHFTMFELILAMYAPPDWNPFTSGDHEPPGLPFPDFGRIKIHRLERGAQDRTLTVDLRTVFVAGDCEKDVSLQWGDVVEIPEADHKVNEHWNGLDETARATLKKCRQSKVSITVKGQTNEVTITVDPAVYASDHPGQTLPMGWHGFTYFPGRFGEHSSGSAPRTELWSFWLSEVVHEANVILYSSDLTRVKVKRTSPQTHKTEEMVFNLEKSSPGNDLWLRDGDVIEIPEKQ